VLGSNEGVIKAQYSPQVGPARVAGPMLTLLAEGHRERIVAGNHRAHREVKGLIGTLQGHQRGRMGRTLLL
jgi:hypothetical protein